MTDLTKYDAESINQMRLKAQNFSKLTHKEPDPKEIQTNKFAGNSKYLPISFLEMQLDEMFFGLWQTKDFKSSVIANEIIGSLELSYFHPTFHTWITRVGTAGTMIQYKSKDKGGTGDITNIKDKIPNTLVKDYPHLKAEAFRNACLSIGKAFGRDLNREFTDTYSPIIKEETDPIIDDYFNKLLIGLDEYIGQDKEQLKKQCSDAMMYDKFTVAFAEKIANKIGLKL